jgi:hypothetical protein
MAMLRRRDRTLVFRLSQDEYASLITASSQSGGRSLSEFVRISLMSQLAAGADDRATPTRVRELEQRMRRLESALLDLEETVKSCNAK